MRVLLSAALGAAIGFERERARKPAGIRTHVIIAAAATLFTLASAYTVTGTDPTRIAAGIVTGIGFLGAGVILHREGGIGGLTTAATIWAVASIGLAVGLGMYLVAPVVTLVILVALLVPRIGA